MDFDWGQLTAVGAVAVVIVSIFAGLLKWIVGVLNDTIKNHLNGSIVLMSEMKEILVEVRTLLRNLNGRGK